MPNARLDVGEVTRLLRRARDGEPAALERLIPLLYEELRRLARRQLGHESYLKLGGIALAGLEPRQRQVVECRYLGGMEEQEIAVALGVSERTVQRAWVRARAWLSRYFLPGSTA